MFGRLDPDASIFQKIKYYFFVYTILIVWIAYETYEKYIWIPIHKKYLQLKFRKYNKYTKKKYYK